jgi:cytochrome oxidase Cu insertion factor (SCO1/SenC/PrrC family)
MARINGFCIPLFLLVLFGLFNTANADIGGDFTLTDHHGKPFHLKDHRGKVVVMSFGFTFCPSICPDTLVKMSSVIEQLQDSSTELTTVFITVDPERDTVEALSKYVPYFSDAILGLTGSADAIRKVSSQYRAMYKIQKTNETDKNYTVDHSADIYVINREGNLESIVPYGMPADHIFNVVQETLKKGSTSQSQADNQNSESVDNRYLIDLAGKQHSIDQWRGKSVVINYWATWCTPCRTELPSLNNAWKQADKKTTQMLAVNIGESAAAVSNFLKDYPIEFPVLLDQSSSSMSRREIVGFPTTIMLDGNGQLVWKVTGHREWDSDEMLAKIRGAD